MYEHTMNGIELESICFIFYYQELVAAATTHNTKHCVCGVTPESLTNVHTLFMGFKFTISQMSHGHIVKIHFK